MRFTDLTIKALKPSEKGQVTYFDDAMPGFSVRVSPGGTKTFTSLVGKERKRYKIGRYGVISLSQARERARELLAARTLGIEEANPSVTFAEAVATYVSVHCAQRNRRQRAARPSAS